MASLKKITFSQKRKMQDDKLSKAALDLEARLQRVLAENGVNYLWYSLWSFLCFIVLLPLRFYGYIPLGIGEVVVPVALIALILFNAIGMINLQVLVNGISRDTMVKCFRWKMVAAYLLLQPRAYALMNQFIERIDAEEREYDKDPLV